MSGVPIRPRCNMCATKLGFGSSRGRAQRAQWGAVVNIEDVLAFQDVNAALFISLYNEASAAMPQPGTPPGTETWSEAARRVCELLGFVTGEEPLWMGLHQAVDGLGGAEAELHEFRDMMSAFVATESQLLRRHGVSDVDAARIVEANRAALLAFEEPTHDEVDELNVVLSQLHTSICDTDDHEWASKPEVADLRKINIVSAVGCSGVLAGTVVNGITTAPVPPLFLMSIAGGLVGAVASMLPWRRRHRRN
jgi:hypothetical protein